MRQHSTDPTTESARPAKPGKRKRRLWIALVTVGAALSATVLGIGTANADDNPGGIDVSGHQGNVD